MHHASKISPPPGGTIPPPHQRIHAGVERNFFVCVGGGINDLYGNLNEFLGKSITKNEKSCNF